jgi:Uma2 family endonuclease
MTMIDQISTAEQLFDAGNLGPCELVGGKLVMMSPAGFNHGWYALNIATILNNFTKPRELGVAVTAEAGFLISRDPDTVRVPDVSFVCAPRVPPGGVSGFFQGPPDLAIEVLSPNDRDIEVNAKIRELLRAGCRLIWIIDPHNRAVRIHRPNSREITVLQESDTLTGEDLLPGFAIEVAKIFS